MRLAITLILGLMIPGIAFASDSEQQSVDQIFAAYTKPNSPGCELGVIRDGNFIYQKGYGEGSLEFGIPLSNRSIFYMGSVSKQFTAASIVLAAEQSRLSLDDDVRKYIPELPDYGHTITLRQMLHHTSGFKDYLGLLTIAGRHAENLYSEQEFLDLITRQKTLNHVPGDEFIYSNTNYFLLGIVLRRTTGKSLASFAEKNIFKPLGMSHTLFYDDHTQVVPGRISAYAPDSHGDFLVDWSTNYDTVGGGGLMSNPDDLLLWDRNFYNDKLGKGTVAKELQTLGVLNDGQPTDYALGLELDTYRGLPIVEHDGGLFGYRTEILRFPEQHFSVICLCNVVSADAPDLARKVANIYLKDKLQPVVASASNSSWPDPALFTGKYLDPRTHLLFSFTTSGGHLVGWGANLRRLGPNQFNDLGSDVLTFDQSGGKMKASLEMNGRPLFSGPKLSPIIMSASALSEFAGTYKSEELDASYKLSIDHGNLLLNNNWNPPVTLTPISEDEFDGGYIGILLFHRDAGQISGLSVFSLRARDVRFKKVG